MGAAIHLERVSVTKQQHVILRDITVAFAPGERCAVAGVSGAGKSTLLRLCNRLEDPSSGELFFDAQPYRDLPPTQLRRRIAMVFQVPVMFAGSVRDNLLVPGQLRAAPAPADAALIASLERVGLPATFLDRAAESLSVGEKQRVSLARALMTDPGVLLLDEPTAALDPTAALRLIESVVALNERGGMTVVMVSHQADHIRALGGRAVLLDHGGIAADGSCAEIAQRWQPVLESGDRAAGNHGS